jgi:hypothetical protein
LPASMWAMMPMLRVLFNGTCLGIYVLELVQPRTPYQR